MAELLCVPLKKSSEVDLVKPLRNLLQATYGGSAGAGSAGAEDPTAGLDEALGELARLRSAAVWKLFDPAALEAACSYYDQLVSLESKVPAHEVQVPFKWKDAFDRGSLFGGRASLTVSSLSYERVCVLFNVCALQSVRAAQQPLDSEDGLKAAARLLQQAAGGFQHLKAVSLQAVHCEPTPDLAPDTLHALAQLMLAQAQEVIAYKCIRDGMKEGMVSRVCAQADDLYGEAARALGRDHLRALWPRDWLLQVAAKQTTFRGLAQLHQSLVCRANKQVGEEIARLQLAVEQLRVSGPPPAGGVLHEQLQRATRHLAEASKDNDFIYHERVPAAAALEPLGRAPVAKALPPPARWEPAGRELFGSLLPLALHHALQAAGARRADAVQAEVSRLRDATHHLNAALAALNLPACAEAEPAAAGALPDSILDKAAAVREAGGLPALRRLAADLPELLQRNKDILDEAERLLREEADADAALRVQFGARWTRTESARLTDSLRANAAKYAQIIDNAVRADAIVQQKLRQHEAGIALLSGGAGELAAGVPAAAPQRARDGAAAGRAAEELRALMRAVAALKGERDALEAEVRAVPLDLRARFEEALATQGAIDEPALSCGALGAALGPLQRRAAASLARQEELLGAVQGAHAALVAARDEGGAEAQGGREAALGRLCAAHDAYQDLTANLQEGAKFYNDLTQLLVAFQNKVSDYCFARKTEKDELLKDLTQEAARAQHRPAPAPPQHHSAAPAPAPAPAPTAQDQAASPAAPAPAALPYPAQPQGMPVPYGVGVGGVGGVGVGGAAYPYYMAPVPALYNPYATLPYPHHAPRMPPPAQQYQPYQYPPAPAPGPAPPPGYNPYQHQ